MVAPVGADGLDADAVQKVDSIPPSLPPQPAVAKYRRVQEGIDEKLRKGNEVFLGASSKLVKLDKNGRPYPVDADGVRRFGKDTVTRPPGMDPNIWWAATPKQRVEAWPIHEGSRSREK